MRFLRRLFNRQLFVTILLLGLLVLLSFPLTKNWRQKQSIDAEIRGLETQAAELEGKNSNLKQVLDYMKSEQFVEEEARTKLNYKKPGESVVVIEGRPDATSKTNSIFFDVPPVPSSATVSAASRNISHWLDYFFGEKK